MPVILRDPCFRATLRLLRRRVFADNGSDKLGFTLFRGSWLFSSKSTEGHAEKALEIGCSESLATLA